MNKSDHQNESSDEATQSFEHRVRPVNSPRRSYNVRNVLRKEDTFIVTDKISILGHINSAEELRRRKAMTLARANASYALKNWGRISTPHRSRDRHHNSISGRDNHNRPHLVSTGKEVKNDRGEKIFFHWKESDFARSRIARVPLGVGKLYQYKKKRLQHKQGSIQGSKSAPEKNAGSGKLARETSARSKRSLTAVIASSKLAQLGFTAPAISADFPGVEETKMKSQVAFEDIKNKNTREKCENTQHKLTVTQRNSTNKPENKPDKLGIKLSEGDPGEKLSNGISSNKTVSKLHKSSKSSEGDCEKPPNGHLSNKIENRIHNSGMRSSEGDVGEKVSTDQRNVFNNSATPSSTLTTTLSYGQQSLAQSSGEISKSFSLSPLSRTDRLSDSNDRFFSSKNMITGMQLKKDRSGSKNDISIQEMSNPRSSIIHDEITDRRGCGNGTEFGSSVKTDSGHGATKLQEISSIKSKTEVMMTSVGTDNTDSRETTEGKMLLKDIDFIDKDEMLDSGRRQAPSGSTRADITGPKSHSLYVANRTSSLDRGDKTGELNSYKSGQSQYESVMSSSEAGRMEEESIHNASNYTPGHKKDNSTSLTNRRIYKVVRNDTATEQHELNSSYLNISQGSTEILRLAKNADKECFENEVRTHDNRIRKTDEVRSNNLIEVGHEVESISANLGEASFDKHGTLSGSKNFVNINSLNNLKPTTRELPDKSTKPSSIVHLTKLNPQSDQSKSTINAQTDAKTKARDGNKPRDLVSTEVNASFKASSNHIDHRFANKRHRRAMHGGRRDRKARFDRARAPQGAQPCVTVSKTGESKLAGHARGWAQQDARVSMATSQVNNFTAGDERLKQAIVIHCTSQHSSSNQNVLGNLKYETLHNESNSINFPENATRYESFLDKTSSVSKILFRGSAEGLKVIRNSCIQEIGDKHVHDTRNGFGSIPTESLKLELTHAVGIESIETQPLSINRYKFETKLTDQKSKSDAHQQRSASNQDVEVGDKTKELNSRPRNKRRNADKSSDAPTKDDIRETEGSCENSNGLDLARSVNSVSTSQKSRGYSDAREDDVSIEFSRSINARTVNSKTVSTGDAGRGYNPVIAEDSLNKESIKTENRVELAALSLAGDISSKRKLSCELKGLGKLEDTVQASNESSVRKTNEFRKINFVSENGISNNSSVISPDNYSQDVQNEAGNKYENLENFRSQSKIHSENEGKVSRFKNFHRKKECDRKRETICLQVQNMEFVGLPEKKEVSNSTNFKEQKHIGDKHSSRVNGDFVAFQRETISNIGTDKKLDGKYNELKNVHHPETVRVDERPKSAGMSAYSKYKNEDLWSVNDDDDDDDDQIQFIDGEQDFFKVFGYNEETVAMFNATQVYPVEGTIHFSDSTRKQDASSSIAKLHDSSIAGEQRVKLTNGFDEPRVKQSGEQKVKQSNGTLYNGVDTVNRTSPVSHGDKTNVHYNTYTGSKTDSTETTNPDQARAGHMKLKLTKSDPTSKAIKPRPAKVTNSERFKHETGYLNIYRKNSNYLVETAGTTFRGDQLLASKDAIVSGVYVKDGPLNSRQDETFGDIFQIKGGKHTKKLVSKQRRAEEVSTKKQDNSACFPNLESGVDSQLSPREGCASGDNNDEKNLKGRKNVSNESARLQIVDETSLMYPLPDNRSSLGDAISLSVNAASVRDMTVPASKDHRSHVALRNHLATEKHINHTRYHRHINNTLSDYKKFNMLQISELTEPQIQRHDTTGARNFKNKDFNKTAPFKYQEDAKSPRNPYVQAADRIISQFSDTENSIATRSDINNSVSNQNGPNTVVNSPLRRMSHPVDSRSTHSENSGSYFVAKPRKLKPIMHLPNIRHNQPFNAGID